MTNEINGSVLFEWWFIECLLFSVWWVKCLKGDSTCALSHCTVNVKIVMLQFVWVGIFVDGSSIDHSFIVVIKKDIAFLMYFHKAI